VVDIMNTGFVVLEERVEYKTVESGLGIRRVSSAKCVGLEIHRAERCRASIYTSLQVLSFHKN
jgi:hypothetical protein